MLFFKRSMFFYHIATLFFVLLSSGCHYWESDVSETVQPLQFNFQLTEKQSIWSKFVGYNTNTHDAQLSVFTPNKTSIVVKKPHELQLLNASDGQIQWTIHTQYRMTGPATADGQRIFVATSEFRLLALHQDNGQILWSVPLPNQVCAQPSIENHQIIVKTVTGDILAFNVSNGKRLWHYQHPNTGRFSLKKSSMPKLYQNKVFAGFPDGRLVVLDSRTGQKIWEHIPISSKKTVDYAELIDVASDPVFEGDTVYFNIYRDRVQALSITSGQIQWEQAIGTASDLELGPYLYMINDENVIVALAKTSGKIIWRQDRLKDHRLIGPVLDPKHQHIIIGDEQGQLYWLSAKNGQILGKATFRISSPLLEPLLLKEGTVYALTRRGQMACWTAKSSTAADFQLSQNTGIIQ